jgi:hypothetical protein
MIMREMHLSAVVVFLNLVLKLEMMKKKIINVNRPEADLFGRIRILALINDPVSTVLLCEKAIYTSGISVVYFLVH